MITRCAYCDKIIPRGADYYGSVITTNRCFCSEKCMKEELRIMFLDEVIDDWFEDNAIVYTEEPDDPYDKYGVDERDFA